MNVISLKKGEVEIMPTGITENLKMPKKERFDSSGIFCAMPAEYTKNIQSRISLGCSLFWKNRGIQTQSNQ